MVTAAVQVDYIEQNVQHLQYNVYQYILGCTHIQLRIFIILTGIIPLVGVRSLNYTGVHSPFSVYQKHVNLQHKHVGMSGQLRMTATHHKMAQNDVYISRNTTIKHQLYLHVLTK